MNDSTAFNITWSSIGKATPMICISMLGVSGNSLVLISVARTKAIRSVPANLFVTNLAVTDIVAALICLPLSYITVICNNRWIFGVIICQAQAFTVVLISNATFLTLFSFSLYRYKTITSQYKYSTPELWRITKAMLCVIWTISAIFSFPPLVGWGEFKFIPSLSNCSLNWSKSLSYSVTILSVSFFVPLCLMIVFYYKIVKFVTEHNKSFLTRNSRPKHSTASVQPELRESVVSEIETVCDFAASKPHVIHVRPVGDSHPMETLSCRNETHSEANISRLSQVISLRPSESPGIFPHGQRNAKGQKRLQLQEKLVKILLVTVLAFQICWLPFAVYSVLETIGFHGSDSSPYGLVALWFAFTNTICNPIIYAFLNEQFRKAFGDTLAALCRVIHCT